MITELHLNLTPMLKKLEIVTKKNLASALTGGYKSVFKGKGLDFDGYRQFQPMDDSEKIDWKASLRTQQIMVKQFKEERNLNIIYLFDVSASMCFSSIDKLKVEYAAELIASLSFANIQVGDNVGMIMFTDKITKSALPSQGPAQFYKITKALSEPKNYDGGFDLDKAVAFYNSAFHIKSIIFLVSDFIGLKNDWKNTIRHLGVKNEVVGFMIRDPRDEYIPQDSLQTVIKDPFSDKELIMNPRQIYKEYEEENKKRKEEIKEEFKKNRMDLIEFRTDTNYVPVIMKYFIMRNKKL
ncbi:MAG: DUF58 domain-containing protein [Nitrospiraceae bacterium]|nr:DUF58 domain-containing protein [Nitrospiraceae bacterium]